MKTFTCKILHPDGLHARPAAEFCKTATGFKSKITLTKDGEDFEAKSILMVLSAGVAHGDEVTITANGEDEKEAIEALKNLLTSHGE